MIICEGPVLFDQENKMPVDHLKPHNLTYKDYKECSIDQLVERLDKNPTGQPSDTFVTMGYVLGKFASNFQEETKVSKKTSERQSTVMWLQLIVMIAQIIIAACQIYKM